MTSYTTSDDQTLTIISRGKDTIVQIMPQSRLLRDTLEVHTPKAELKKIGRVSKGRGVNWFDRAMEEAARRNDDGKRPRHCPGWQYEKTALGRR